MHARLARSSPATPPSISPLALMLRLAASLCHGHTPRRHMHPSAPLPSLWPLPSLRPLAVGSGEASPGLRGGSSPSSPLTLPPLHRETTTAAPRPLLQRVTNVPAWHAPPAAHVQTQPPGRPPQLSLAFEDLRCSELKSCTVPLRPSMRMAAVVYLQQAWRQGTWREGTRRKGGGRDVGAGCRQEWG